MLIFSILQELKEVGKEQPKVEAELPANVSKNRYPHVLPCKCCLLPPLPSFWGGGSHCNAQGQAPLASLQGSQCLAPLLAEGLLKWISVSTFLLETQGLRVEAWLNHHPHLLQKAAGQVLGEDISGMGPRWSSKGDQRCPMASLISIMIAVLLSYPALTQLAGSARRAKVPPEHGASLLAAYMGLLELLPVHDPGEEEMATSWGRAASRARVCGLFQMITLGSS